MVKTLTILRVLFCISIFSVLLLCDKPTEPTGDVEPTGFDPVLSSSTQEIHDFLLNGNGTANAKLVFVKKIMEGVSTFFNNLYYIDLSEVNDTPVVHTIAAAKGAQVPVISPDGKWVVFAKGSRLTEAGATAGSKSSTYLCKIEEDAVPTLLMQDSAFEPRFMQNAAKLTVIFPTEAQNYSWRGIGRTLKMEIDVSGSTPVAGKPEVLFATAGFTGGLSTDGKYLCGGGGNIGMVDRTSGNTVGDTACDFPQACNASISASSIFTNMVMYLTTVGSHPNVNGGQMWQSWQVILINNNQKEVIKGYTYPTQFKIPLDTSNSTFRKAMWHHCEWSNHPYFAAATLNIRRTWEGTNATEYQEQIYLINLKDSTYIEVLRPDSVEFSGILDDNSGYFWPWLWVEKPSGFQEDQNWLKP